MRIVVVVIIVVAALAAAVLAQGQFYNLENLWRSGQFDAARELISSNLSAGQEAPEFNWEAATASEAMRDYARAADLFARYAEQFTGEPGIVRKARQHEFTCRWLDSNGNKRADWIREAQDYVDGLRENKDEPSLEQLALELDYILTSITGSQTEFPLELAQKYPNSDLVLQEAKEQLDKISTQPDSDVRMAMINQFLEDFPHNYWRHVAYRYWLYTEWLDKDHPGLREAADAYTREYPNHPESLGVASRYFYEADVEHETGMQYARRSKELYATAVGLDGSVSSIQRANDRTRSLPVQPDHLVGNQRQQFLDYLGSRYNLARYLVSTGDGQDALDEVLPVIEADPYTMEEDLTLAPFYLVAGQAAEVLEDQDSAYRYYVGAVIAGDNRNRFAFQAEQRLAELVSGLGSPEHRKVLSEFIPSELANVVLPVFVDFTTQAGLNDLNYERVAWGDIDGDHDPDLLLDGSLLMGNDSGARFGNASRGWNFGGKSTGGLFADYDNDGDLDIYSTAGHGNPDRLWRNDGDKYFDITALAGKPSDDYASEGAAWVDYDNDGWLDLYVANYEQPGENDSQPGSPDSLYHNAEGVFQPVGLAAIGIKPPFGENQAGRGVSAADFDGDGDTDIFVGNYRLQENCLWENLGIGGFTNSARLNNVAGYSVEGWWGHTIGSCWGDVNNDGRLDLFSANLAHPRYAYFSDKSMLLVNEGIDGLSRFIERRGDWGIRYEETHAGPVFFDANNDGWLDLYITSVYPNRRSFLYLNDGHGKFHDVTWICGARVFNGWGVAWADFDADGDLDLAVGSADGMHLLKNTLVEEQTLAGGANWLQVSCNGTQQKSPLMDPLPPGSHSGQRSNRSGIGSRVTVTSGSLSQLREICSGEGSTSGSELMAHFGFGGYSGKLKVVVRFTSGLEVVLNDVSVNQRIVVNEADALPPGGVTPETAEPTDGTAEEEFPDRADEGFLDSLDRPR